MSDWTFHVDVVGDRYSQIDRNTKRVYTNTLRFKSGFALWLHYHWVLYSHHTYLATIGENCRQSWVRFFLVQTFWLVSNRHTHPDAIFRLNNSNPRFHLYVIYVFNILYSIKTIFFCVPSLKTIYRVLFTKYSLLAYRGKPNSLARLY